MIKRWGEKDGFSGLSKGDELFSHWGKKKKIANVIGCWQGKKNEGESNSGEVGNKRWAVGSSNPLAKNLQWAWGTRN